jgi:hypothetical protein
MRFTYRCIVILQVEGANGRCIMQEGQVNPRNIAVSI